MVREEVDVIVTCTDDGKTGVNVTIYLDEVQVVIDQNHKKEIQIDDELSIKMKYPTMEMVMEADNGEVTVEKSLGLIAGCIDQIYTEDESWAASDSTEQELVSWVEELEPKNFAKLEQFFTTMPKLSHTIQVTNPETGVESEVVMEGLGSFFA